MSNYSGQTLKPLREVLGELKGGKPRPKQTSEEMLEAMRVIRATMGG